MNAFARRWFARSIAVNPIRFDARPAPAAPHDGEMTPP